MGKRRKTYKEKLISDLRRKVYNPEGLNTASFAPEKKNPVLLQNQAQLDQSQYPYLLKDISKTAILTASIIAVQILLFFVLKKHIVVLPGVTY